MPNNANNPTDAKLDVIIELLRNLLAIELAKSGVIQSNIAKRLHISTSRANSMLRGIGKSE